MYITETTENVRDLVEKLERKNDITKIRFLIYIFNLLNNKQINDKNEANPDLAENDEIEIFTLSTIGFQENACTIFLQYLAMVHNVLTSSKSAYERNGNILGIENDKEDKELASIFEKLEFIEKLDIFSELIIRYDNGTYFENGITILSFDSKSDGYAIAKMIKDYKESLKK